MRCDRARAAISERMDGERLAPRTAAGLDRHLASCAGCASFERRARSLRAAVRIRPAEPIPDLVAPIMRAVAAEARTVALERPATEARPAAILERPSTSAHPSVPRRPAPPHGLGRRGRRGSPEPATQRRPGRLAPVAAALLAGAVAGSALVGGLPGRAPTTIASADVPREVSAAARRLDAYRASFLVTERNLDADTPLRELTVHVWFRAPDRFRLDVLDHGSGTSTRAPGDVSLVVSGSRWSLTAPTACPPSLASACPGTRTVVRERPSLAPPVGLPTDLVVPLDTLTAAPDVRVLGREEAMGREAIRLELPVERAAPLFAFMRLGGTWRPLFPRDRVELWVDAERWFPLRFRVLPAVGRTRDRWEERFGLPDERAGRAVLEATALALDERPAAPGTFAVPEGTGATGQAEDTDRARVVDLADVPGLAGFRPVAPPDLAGLPALGAEVLTPGPGGANEALVLYSDGLAWLRFAERPAGDAGGPFGPVDRLAEEVALADGGVAYYEPATGDRGRRLSVHADAGDLYLESNLPRRELLRIAAELPVLGEPMPEAWRVRSSAGEVSRRISLEEAIGLGAVPVLLPEDGALPPGYAFASAELLELGGRPGLTLRFRHAGSDLVGPPIRIHLEVGVTLPPASSARQSTVALPDGGAGRWTPSRHRLEVVLGGIYVSIDGEGLGLPEATQLAAALRPWAGAGEAPS